LRRRISWYGRPLATTAAALASLAAWIHFSADSPGPAARVGAFLVVLWLIASLVWTLLRFTGTGPAQILRDVREPWRRFRDIVDAAPRRPRQRRRP
jgi:hypothetical protein